MRIFFFFLLSILTFACHKAVSPEQQALTSALDVWKANPSDSTAQQVTARFDHYLEVRGYNDPATPDLLLTMAGFASKRNDLQQAMSFYKAYLLNYPDRPDHPDRLAEVITLSEKMERPQLTQVLYKSFVHRFPKDSRTSSMNTKIENKDIAVDSLLRYMGNNIFNDSIFRLNEERSRLYIDACEAAVMADPNLANGPEFLHRAAETARTLRDIPKAIQLYNWIIDHYPTHSRAATSLFLKAFTYDNDLKDFQKAGAYYNEFIEKYPANEFTESAKFLLNHLGKSEEELRKMLESNRAKENIQ